MIKVTVQKNLIGLEDLLVGVGTVSQTRGPTGTAPVTITKINGANFPYDETYSMSEKFDALQAQIDTLPVVVDEGGNLLTGLINTSALDLNLAGRLWRKEVDADTAALYYGTELLFEYDPADGNIYIPGGTDYIAADAIVTAAFQSADSDLQDLIDALDLATTNVQDLDVGTNPNDLVQLDGTGKLPAVDGSQLTGLPSGTPIGAIIWTAHSSVDTGYLKCNGQAVSRTTYAALYAKLGDAYGEGDGSTTFNVPDLRGEFIRGYDDGRGVDTGRTLGSAQTDSLKAHTHTAGTLVAASGGSHTHTIDGASGTTGEVSPASSEFDMLRDRLSATSATTEAAGTHTHTISGSTGSSGANETKPRNVALQAVIKAL